MPNILLERLDAQSTNKGSFAYLHFSYNFTQVVPSHLLLAVTEEVHGILTLFPSLYALKLSAYFIPLPIINLDKPFKFPKQIILSEISANHPPKNLFELLLLSIRPAFNFPIASLHRFSKNF